MLSDEVASYASQRAYDEASIRRLLESPSIRNSRRQVTRSGILEAYRRSLNPAEVDSEGFSQRVRALWEKHLRAGDGPTGTIEEASSAKSRHLTANRRSLVAHVGSDHLRIPIYKPRRKIDVMVPESYLVLRA